jgi:hypothetical protein
MACNDGDYLHRKASTSEEPYREILWERHVKQWRYIGLLTGLLLLPQLSQAGSSSSGAGYKGDFLYGAAFVVDAAKQCINIPSQEDYDTCLNESLEMRGRNEYIRLLQYANPRHLRLCTVEESAQFQRSPQSELLIACLDLKSTEKTSPEFNKLMLVFSQSGNNDNLKILKVIPYDGVNALKVNKVTYYSYAGPSWNETYTLTNQGLVFSRQGVSPNLNSVIWNVGGFGEQENHLFKALSTPMLLQFKEPKITRIKAGGYEAYRVQFTDGRKVEVLSSRDSELRHPKLLIDPIDTYLKEIKARLPAVIGQRWVDLGQ